jgi:hypothetical protein
MGFLLAVFINDELEAVLVGMLYFLQFKKIHNYFHENYYIFFSPWNLFTQYATIWFAVAFRRWD